MAPENAAVGSATRGPAPPESRWPALRRSGTVRARMSSALRFGIVTLVAACVAARGAAQMPAVFEQRTPGGMRIWSFPHDGADSFAIAVLVGVGACDEPPQHRGIAHFLEHVILASTASRAKATLDRDLSGRGISCNGFTTHEHTVYHLHGPAGQWRFMVDWLADHLVRPGFLAEDVEGERRIVANEIGTGMPHAGVATVERFLYPEHALAEPVGGSLYTLEQIDGADLRDFYDSFYRTGNVCVGFAGRVPRDECMAEVGLAFARLPVGQREAPPPGPAPRCGTIAVPHARGRAGRVWVGFHLEAGGARELAEQCVLARYLDERFLVAAREERKLAYAPRVELVRHRQTQRLQFVAEVTGGAAADELIEVVGNLLAELEAPLPAEVERAQRAPGAVFQVSDVASLADAMQWAAWLAFCADAAGDGAAGNGPAGNGPAAFAAAGLELSPAELAGAARRHLRAERRFEISEVARGGAVTAWGMAAMLLFVFALFDGFAGFPRSRRVGAAIGRRLRRRARVPAGGGPDVVRPVDGDEIARSFQRWFEEEDRLRGGR